MASHRPFRSLVSNIPKAISNLSRIGTTSNPVAEDLFTNPIDRTATSSSPKENISSLRDELHGHGDWSNLLDPLHPWLRHEIIKYGEFSQATYDAFDCNSFSKYSGSSLYSPSRLFEKLGLTGNGYCITKYIYAMSNVELPRWLEHSLNADTWSKDSNWMGFVAVSDNAESRRIGFRDIVVAWRGTVSPAEWLEDMQLKLEPLRDGEGHVKVEHGFLSIYTSKSEATRYNKSSASEQVMEEIRRLVAHYRGKGEQVSLTITGHSLGGALAQLNAHEAALSFPDLPVSVISFAAPRVGNDPFGDEMIERDVKVLRVVVKQDVVPKFPGVLLNERLIKMLKCISGLLDWVYAHVGSELSLDVNASPYLKHGFDLVGFHGLEMYMHLVDGYLSEDAGFRPDARRDIALVNKFSGMLRDELKIPPSWDQPENKGMVRNAHGLWVVRQRAPEDIPSSYRHWRLVVLP
ncbi:hypothetical protein J5N97_022735 [Dioscorea zingiberensis]|uniref:Fungal lipase-type domain-containing protein n=1 Tax=Dioscorea zingiberensis TaxID=325984 RepID=A0A9D5HB98_9LILI|nr:hypothetical protein J5N97_022735 [Dioscorea zingiberensis]